MNRGNRSQIWFRPVPLWTEPKRALRCFKINTAFWCCNGPHRLRLSHIIEQATNGRTNCPKCGKPGDLRDFARSFPVLGVPERLLGLDVKTFVQPIEPSNEYANILIDLRRSFRRGDEVVYANTSVQCEGSIFEVPQLVAPQTSTDSVHLLMRFVVPPGGRRAINLTVAVRPRLLEPPLEFAVDAIAPFHSRKYTLACLMLSASIEASLRNALAKAYKARAVEFADNIGLAELVNRSRLLLRPAIGSHLVGHLNELRKAGRNPSAHGKIAALTQEQVAGWMVDAAVIYEWAKRAKPR